MRDRKNREGEGERHRKKQNKNNREIKRNSVRKNDRVKLRRRHGCNFIILILIKIGILHKHGD